MHLCCLDFFVLQIDKLPSIRDGDGARGICPEPPDIFWELFKGTLVFSFVCSLC